jgi:hypothetical protein
MIGNNLVIDTKTGERHHVPITDEDKSFVVGMDAILLPGRDSINAMATQAELERQSARDWYATVLKVSAGGLSDSELLEQWIQAREAAQQRINDALLGGTEAATGDIAIVNARPPLLL